MFSLEVNHDLIMLLYNIRFQNQIEICGLKELIAVLKCYVSFRPCSPFWEFNQDKKYWNNKHQIKITMGITGLLPFLKNASRPASLDEFSGKVAAVDVYVWLHRYTYYWILA